MGIKKFQIPKKPPYIKVPEVKIHTYYMNQNDYDSEHLVDNTYEEEYICDNCDHRWSIQYTKKARIDSKYLDKRFR